MTKPKALPSSLSPAKGTTLATVFGGGGFVGRYVVAELLNAGVRVRVAGRNPKNAAFLRQLGNMGQTQFAAADITRPDTVRRAVAGSDTVINLVGVLAGDYTGVQVDGARHVAEAAAAAGATRLVQMSAIGADPDSASAYGQSKGLGEDAVRHAFPDATILRPSIVFGREDEFINRFATMIRLAPLVPVVAPEARFQPVFAGDVGRATALVALHDGHAARTYELGGPQVLTMRQLFDWIAARSGASGRSSLCRTRCPRSWRPCPARRSRPTSGGCCRCPTWWRTARWAWTTWASRRSRWTRSRTAG